MVAQLIQMIRIRHPVDSTETSAPKRRSTALNMGAAAAGGRAGASGLR
jgi:hypothetical protein